MGGLLVVNGRQATVQLGTVFRVFQELQTNAI